MSTLRSVLDVSRESGLPPGALPEILHFDVVSGIAVGVVVMNRLLDGMPPRLQRHPRGSLLATPFYTCVS